MVETTFSPIARSNMTRRRLQQTARRPTKRDAKADVETVVAEAAVVVVDVESPQGAAAEYMIRKVVIAVLGLANTLE